MPAFGNSSEVPNDPRMQQVMQRSDLPPLRVYHFLAWMTVTAVWLGASPFGGTGDAPKAFVVSWFLSILGATLAVTCCGFGFWWRHRRMAFPDAPGQWLCIIFCIAIIFAMLHGFVYSLCIVVDGQGMLHYREPTMLTAWFDRWGWKLSNLPCIALNIWLAKKLAAARVWMWFFLLSAVSLTVSVFGGQTRELFSLLLEPLGTIAFPFYRVIQFLIYAKQLVPFLALLLACRQDRRHAVTRHWCHWCGVIAWLTLLPSDIVVACANMGWIATP